MEGLVTSGMMFSSVTCSWCVVAIALLTEPRIQFKQVWQPLSPESPCHFSSLEVTATDCTHTHHTVCDKGPGHMRCVVTGEY